MAETNAERLRNIKNTLTGMRIFLMESKISSIVTEEIYEDMKFLIEQAERVQELEKLSERWMKNHDITAGEYLQLQKENKRYLEALKDISEGAGPPETIALVALEGEDS